MTARIAGAANPADGPEPATPLPSRWWAAADAYQRFMGGWSREVAEPFLEALHMRAGRRWLDVGCGAGVLSRAIAERCAPTAVVGIDPSRAFIEYAMTANPPGSPVQFRLGAAEALPFPAAAFDATVSGLTLNFTAHPAHALQELVRVTRPGGTVAAYVWDYDHPDFFLNRFWHAVACCDGTRASDDERGRWPACSSAGLRQLAQRSALRNHHVWTIEIATVFASKNALWDGFLLGVGPSGAWTAGLDPDRRARLRTHFDAALASAGGSPHLTAKAIALRGTAP